MHSRFIHVITNGRIPFQGLNNIYVCVCACVCVYTHYVIYTYNFLNSFIHRQTGCFHILAIVNMLQWIWKCRYLFKRQIISHLEVGMLDHMMVLFLAFRGTPNIVLNSASYQSTFPVTVNKDSLSPHSSNAYL